jgi:DNA/RNA endonuclease YhcR with UshA esterase domain
MIFCGISGLWIDDRTVGWQLKKQEQEKKTDKYAVSRETSTFCE